MNIISSQSSSGIHKSTRRPVDCHDKVGGGRADLEELPRVGSAAGESRINTGGSAGSAVVERAPVSYVSRREIGRVARGRARIYQLAVYPLQSRDVTGTAVVERLRPVPYIATCHDV